MQFRRRASTSPTRSHRPGAAAPVWPTDAVAPDGPRSAARLAAEAAFLQHPPANPAASVAVVVKRRPSRLPLTTAAPIPGVATPAPTPETAEPHKRPRVFQVRTAPAAQPASRTVEANEEPPVKPAPAATARRRRTAAVQRPGPLLQVFQAPALDRSETTPEQPTPALTTRAVEVPAEVAAQLADLDATFDEIRRAQSFDLGCPTEGRAWQRLAQAVAGISAQIQRVLVAGAPVAMTREQVFKPLAVRALSLP